MPVSRGLRARSKTLLLLFRPFGAGRLSCQYSHLTTLRRRSERTHPIVSSVGPESMPTESRLFSNLTAATVRSETLLQVAVSGAPRQFSTSGGFESAGNKEAPGTKGNNLLVGGLVAILLTALGLLEYKGGFLSKRDAKSSAELGPQSQEKAEVRDATPLLVSKPSEQEAEFTLLHENAEHSTTFNEKQEQLVGTDGNQEESAASNEPLDSTGDQGALESMKSSENVSLGDPHSKEKDIGRVQTSEKSQQVVESIVPLDEASDSAMPAEDASPSHFHTARESEDFGEGDSVAHSGEQDAQEAAGNSVDHLLLSEHEDTQTQEPEISHPPTEVSESKTSEVEPDHKKGSLSEMYLLQKGHEDNVSRYLGGQKEEISDAVPISESIKVIFQEENMEVGEDAARSSKEVKPTVDIVAAIHAAEQRQAEVDAAAYAQQLQDVEHTYQRQLQDLQKKMLALLERSKRLEQDFESEKVKHDLKVRMLQESSETKLQTELKLQEEANKVKLEEAKLLAQVEALAIFVEENVALLKELGKIKLQIEALYAAFNARSEEAQQSHAMHKLALGTLSLEDAMLRGIPLEKEIALVLETAGAPEIDPLVQVAVMSVPADAIKEGTSTPAELQEQFWKMRRLLSELALIPVDGGGVLTHAFAWLASFLKVSEDGSRVGNGGIESVLGQVASFLAEGKLAEAADTLERSSRGTKAQKLASEWAREVRNRLVMEQALSVLRAHSIANSLSFF